jgi:hypothetical protein
MTACLGMAFSDGKLLVVSPDIVDSPLRPPVAPIYRRELRVARREFEYTYNGGILCMRHENGPVARKLTFSECDTDGSSVQSVWSGHELRTEVIQNRINVCEGNSQMPAG